MHGLVKAARTRIREHVAVTPLIRSPWLSAATGASVYLKLENLQWTGSFKLRGAFNRLLTTPVEQRRRGVVSASTGNHGAAIAFAGSRLDAPILIFAPKDAATAKIEKIRALGADIRFTDGDALESELTARQYAKDHKIPYVSPYNDADVIAGQGTVGVELLEQFPNVDTVIAAVGGGGLVSGIGVYLKEESPDCQILGASPRNSPAMYDALRQGAITESQCLPTLSDGTAGGIEPGAVTFSICQDVIDEMLLVDEPAIAEAIRTILWEHHLVIEGSAGVAVAAATQRNLTGRNVAIVLCGGNIDADSLLELL